MGIFEIILLSGIGLGLVQLAAGVAIGVWLGRRRTHRGGADWARAQRLASELGAISAELSGSLQDHEQRVIALGELLSRENVEVDGDHGSVTELVVGVVSELLAANGQLALDLQQSRAELADRIEELNEHRDQALTDPLTGLPNRRAFDDQLSDCVEAWRKRQSPFTVMLIDIDHFKQFNDRFGHQTGDSVLRAVAGALQEALRNYDLVARYGGEEFGVLLPFTTKNDDTTFAVEEALRAVACLEIETREGMTGATVSIGLASILPQERAHSLIERADQALYAAKENGRAQGWRHDGERLVAISTEPQSGEFATVEIQQACEELSASLSAFMEHDAEEPVPAPSSLATD